MGAADEIRKLHKTLTELKKDLQETEVLGAKLQTELKGYVPIEFLVEGFIKSYKDAVKRANSLTVMKPSVIKALDKASQRPTKSAISQTKAKLEEHLKEVAKTHAAAAKKDKNTKKTLDKFTGNIKAIIGGLDKQDTVS